jgi:hypothetical protein
VTLSVLLDYETAFERGSSWCFLSTYRRQRFFKGDYCMKNGQHDHGDVGLAEIWRNANHRRTQDVWRLITEILKTVAVQTTRTRNDALGKTLLASGDSSFAPGKARMTGG